MGRGHLGARASDGAHTVELLVQQEGHPEGDQAHGRRAALADEAGLVRVEAAVDGVVVARR